MSVLVFPQSHRNLLQHKIMNPDHDGVSDLSNTLHVVCQGSDRFV